MKLDLDELVLQIREYREILGSQQSIRPDTPSQQLKQYAEDLIVFIERAEKPGSLRDTRDQLLLDKLEVVKRLADGVVEPDEGPDIEYAVQILATDWIATMHRRLSAELVRRIRDELATRKR